MITGKKECKRQKVIYSNDFLIAKLNNNIKNCWYLKDKYYAQKHFVAELKKKNKNPLLNSTLFNDTEQIRFSKNC